VTRNSTDLATTVAGKREGLTKGDNIFALIERMKPAIEKALPENIGVERFARVVLTEIRRNPKIGECSQESILGALMLSAQLGLEPGNSLGHAYLIPYGRDLQFQLGYKGYILLAYRSGGIIVNAYDIHAKDIFEFNYGTGIVNHTYRLGSERGPVVGVWAQATMPNGTKSILVMPLDEVEARRKRSRAANAGPWVTDYNAMAKKTVIRALFSQLPLSAEAQRAAAVDDSTAEARLMGDTIDLQCEVDPEEPTVDATTGEIGE
jgi:recombination protein RecT